MSSYLFIDGAYLRERFEHQMMTFYGVVPAIQFDVLAANLGGHRTYYYDAINYNRGPSESESDFNARITKIHRLHDYISSQPGFHVREGHVRRSPVRKRQEQKGVDVQLAVDALEHAARGNMEIAALLAGDLDFEPLLTSLARLGVRTRLFYATGHAAVELRQAADEVQTITLQNFWGWATSSFKTNYRQVRLHYNQARPDGFTIERQGIWNTRQVLLLKAGHQAEPRLWVAPGDELTEPSYLFEYVDIDKLPLAFELTFGAIEWG
jgi:uncharacterized LabA/DUF88 family protein